MLSEDQTEIYVGKRRSGKTTKAFELLLKNCLDGKNCAYYSNNRDRAKYAFKNFVHFIPKLHKKIGAVKIKESKLMCEINEKVIYFTTHNPIDRTSEMSVDYKILDEAFIHSFDAVFVNGLFKEEL